jgi:hypothetical protein
MPATMPFKTFLEAAGCKHTPHALPGSSQSHATKVLYASMELCVKTGFFSEHGDTGVCSIPMSPWTDSKVLEDERE